MGRTLYAYFFESRVAYENYLKEHDDSLDEYCCMEEGDQNVDLALGKLEIALADMQVMIMRLAAAATTAEDYVKLMWLTHFTCVCMHCRMQYMVIINL